MGSDGEGWGVMGRGGEDGRDGYGEREEQMQRVREEGQERR